MRLTDEQRQWREWLRELVAPVNARARITVDAEGWPIVPGRLGQVEVTTDPDWLGVYTTRMRIVKRIGAIPGMRYQQVGDREARAWFPAARADVLRQVFQIIRPRVKRASDTAKHLSRTAAAA